MTILLVPYHQDERLPERTIPLAAPLGAETVEAMVPDGDVWPRLVALYERVANRVAERLAADDVPAVVSGDCLVAAATITGAQRAGSDPAVVWFDAHGDVHTSHTSASGYLGGMALRLVLGAHPERLAEPLGLRSPAERRALLVDARDLDPPEVDYLSRSDLRRCGVEELQEALPAGPIVLHIDVDVIDCGELAGLRFPVPNGPSRSTVVDAARRVLATGRVVAVDIACPWYPARDEHEIATRARLLDELVDAVRNSG
ncbi:MAG: arginase family protein [Saccharopolyspora sp.]|uniref:arginase family protein n=1 Tax=Saccharopolyspora sp. TaxID=33915 RepID=UPI0025E81CA4|nr:arginase family protein [Saccharopolyspora sp.]MBQ6644417.1 arginase family protein [Saccharopolyspora sp.]